MTLSDHIDVLAEGRMIAQGTPQAVSRDARVSEAYLGPDGRRRDLVAMALTRPEWLRRAAPAR